MSVPNRMKIFSGTTSMAELQRVYFSRNVTSTNMATVNSLPNEVLCTVFGCLSIDDLVYTVPNVCHRWKMVSEDTSLWRKRTFRPVKYKRVEDVVCFLKKVPKLHHVDLNSITNDYYINIDEILNLLSQRFPELLTLSIGMCALYSYEVMSHFLCISNSLKSLNLVVNENYPKLLHALCNAKKLKHLSLTNFSVLEHGYSKFICSVVQNCCLLETLKLSLCVYDVKKMFSILEVAKHVLTYVEIDTVHAFQQALLQNIFVTCNKLKTLKFSTKDPPYDMINLANFGKLPCLRKLDVSNFKLMPRSLTQLFLQNSWTHLEVLNLENIRTLENFLVREVFASCPNLQSVDVSRGNISDFGMTCLVEHCPKLRHLNVSRTNITDKSLVDLWKCPLLETLVLSACHTFTPRVLNYIVKCENLKLIDLSNNPWLNDRGVEQILNCHKLETLKIGFCESVSGIFFHSVKCFPPTLREIELSQFIHEDFYTYACQKMQSLKVTTVDKYSEYRLSNDTSAYP